MRTLKLFVLAFGLVALLRGAQVGDTITLYQIYQRVNVQDTSADINYGFDYLETPSGGIVGYGGITMGAQESWQEEMTATLDQPGTWKYHRVSGFIWDSRGEVGESDNVQDIVVSAPDPEYTLAQRTVWQPWQYTTNWGPVNYGSWNWDPRNYGSTSWGPRNYGSPSYGQKNYGSTTWGSKNFGSTNWGSWTYTDNWGPYSSSTNRNYTSFTAWTPDASQTPSNQQVTQTRTAYYTDTTTFSRTGTQDGSRSGTVDWTQDGTTPWTRDVSTPWTQDGTTPWTQHAWQNWTQNGTVDGIRYGALETYIVETGQVVDSQPLQETSSDPVSNSGTSTFDDSGSDSTSQSGTDSSTDSGNDSTSQSGTDNVSDSSSTPIADSYQNSTDGSETQSQTVWGTGPIVPVTATISASSATYGSSITVSWGSSNASSVSVTGSGVNSTAATGSQAVSGLSVGSYTYTITAQGYQGPAVQSATATISPKGVTFAIGNTTQTYTGSPLPVTVSPSDNNATYTVTYSGSGYGPSATAPANAGTYTVTVAANGNYTGSQSGTLTINKRTPTITWPQPAAITYGTALSGTQLNATASVPGSFVYSPASGSVLAAGSQTLGTTFTPTDTANNNTATASVSLTVNKATLTVSANNQTRAYGAANPTFTVSYSGFVGSDSAASLTTQPTCSTTATAASAPGPYAIVPAGGVAANYTFNYVNGTLTVTKAAAGVTLTNLTHVYDGNPKSAGATTTPAGLTVTFTYNGSATPPTNVGSYTVVGTVNDTNYQGSATGTLTITKATPTVTWATPAAITYGTALSGTQLNATANVPGSFAYSPAVGAVLNAGAQTLNVTFTPTDSANYNTATGSVTLTVNKATPVITWATPAAITYGTALSGSQLNASTSVPGTFVYSPASGTVLNAGSQTLSVTFTPTNPSNYNSASSSVTLTVNKAPLTVTASNASKTYGAANPAFTATYSGFLNGDTSSVVVGAPTFSTPATSSSPAGTYAITPAIGTLSATNYSFTSFVNGTLTVNKAPLTATADNQTKVYGAANPSLTISYSGFVNGDTAASITAPTASTTATAASGVGSYTITLAGGSSANYNITLVNGTLTVTKAPLTVTANNQSRAYGAANPALTYAITGYVNGDTSAVVSGSPAVTTTATTASAVGTYPITPAIGTLAAANYSFSFVNGTLTVSKASLTVTANDQSRAYGAANPSLTYTLTGFVNGDTAAVVSGAAAVTTPATSSSAVGTYTITPAIGTLTAANYTFGPFVNGTLTVTKASLTVTANNKSKVYGAANPTFDATITGFVNGDTSAVVSGSPAFSTTATNSSAAGTYPITPAIGTLTAANYSFSTFMNGTLTVTKAPLTATADAKSKIYGASNPSLTISYSGFVNGDTVSAITPPTASTTATAASGVGTYTITLSGGTAANYTITSVNGTLTVTKAPLTITATDQSKVYGAANPSLTMSYSGFVNGDSSSSITPPSISTTATAASSVGTYPITLSGGSSANYTLSLVNGTLTVTKAPLTATADNQTRVYGAANPSLTISYSGFVNGDTASSITQPTASTPATAASAVGTYAITLSGGAATNYTISLVNGTLTVTKAALTVTANNQSKTYGAANPTLTYTITGFVNGDTSSVVSGAAAVTTAATNASSVGTYAITPAVGTLAATNYTFGSFVAGTLTVNKAPLTATADAKTKTYGSANPALTISYSGFVNGDSSSSITQPAASTAATASSGVGSYAITLSGGSATNYTISLVNGTLTVTPATLTVTANNQSRAYGAANPALTVSYSGFVNGDTTASLSGSPSVTTAATATSNVGTYSIVPTTGTLSSANYQFSFVNGTLTVVAKAVTFTFSNLSHTYDGNAKTATAVPSDPLATFTSDLTKGPAAGSYPVTATATGNYSGSGSATLTIAQAVVTFTFGNLSHTFNGTSKTATVTPSNPLATYTSDLTKGPSAGTYVVSATANGNYSGSGSANLVISAASQTVTLNPPTATLFVNQPGTFTAAGGQNGYVWGGNAGASGSSAAVTLSFVAEGTYTLTVYSPASNDYTQSNTATATIQVVSNHAVTGFTPVANSYTVNDSTSPMNGQTYKRIWQDGGWTAYLGRQGVKFQVVGQAYPSVQAVEVQSKAPGGQWTQLASQTPSGTPTNVDIIFDVMLDTTVPGNSLMPSSYQAGAPLTGTWTFRARVQDSTGSWSDYSSEVPVEVVLPITTKTIQGQTLPPIGPLGDWFTASPVQNYTYQFWIP